MSITTRSLVLAAAVAFFSSASAVIAQDKPAAPQKPGDGKPRAERKIDEFGRGMGRRGFGMRRGMGMRGFGRPMMMARGLGLTEAQKAQIRSIREANRPSEALREEIRSLVEARRSGSMTEAQRTRVTQLKQEARARRENIRSQILAILTPEQRAVLERRREERRQLMEDFRRFREERRARQKDAPKPSTY